MDITREDALKEIRSMLQGLGDEALEDILFGMFGCKTLYNFRIVRSYDGDWPIKYEEGCFDHHHSKPELVENDPYVGPF